MAVTTVRTSVAWPKFPIAPPPAIAVPAGAVAVPLFPAKRLSLIVATPSMSIAPSTSAAAVEDAGMLALD